MKWIFRDLRDRSVVVKTLEMRVSKMLVFQDRGRVEGIVGTADEDPAENAMSTSTGKNDPPYPLLNALLFPFLYLPCPVTFVNVTYP